MSRDFRRKLLNDIRVELTNEFDRNFTRKAFFDKKWKPRRNRRALGSLLLVTGSLRRSIKSKTTTTGVKFTSTLPYASIHNEGGKVRMLVKSHTRRSRKGKTYNVRPHTRIFTMPKRQFIGDGPNTKQIIKNVIEDNLKDFNLSLTNFLKE